MIIDFIAAFSFWLIPYLTGRLFTKGILQSFSLGSLMWFAVYFAVSGLTNRFNIPGFETIIYFIAVLISVVSITRIIIEHNGFSFTEKKPLFLLFTLGTVVYFLIWKASTPYPMHLNWDIYEHITLSNKISDNIINLRTTLISDTFTFDSYPPLLHVLLAIPKIIFKTDLLGMYYFLEYFYFLLTIASAYLLGKMFFRDSAIGIMSGLFAVFVFENFMAYTSFFLIPQNLAALLTVFTLISLIQNSISRKFLGITLLSIFLMHYIIGSVGILIILLFILLRNVTLKTLRLSLLGSVLILGLVIAAHNLWNFILIEREEAAHFSFPLIKKAMFILDWFSLSLAFLPVSYVLIFKNDSKHQKTLLILTLLIASLSMAPAAYFLKFFVFDHYMLSVIIASGIGFLIMHLNKIFKTVAIFWIGLSLFFVFYKSQAIFKEPLYFEGYRTHISLEEINAAKWLAQNFPHALIISDPSTQYILEAVSGVNSQGGAFMANSTRKILSEIKDSTDSAQIKEKLSSVEDILAYEKNSNNTLLILSGRYFLWQNLPEDQNLSFYFNVWAPKKLSNQDKIYITSLTRNGRIKNVFQNSELAILKI